MNVYKMYEYVDICIWSILKLMHLGVVTGGGGVWVGELWLDSLVRVHLFLILSSSLDGVLNCYITVLLPQMAKSQKIQDA